MAALILITVAVVVGWRKYAQERASQVAPLPAGSTDEAPAVEESPSASAVASTSAHPAAMRRVQSVLLLTVDTLRADQPWNGYDKAKTPHLSRLAEQSVLYTHAYSVANTTTPSLSAILSARYPTELQRDNCPLAGFNLGQGLVPFLKEAGFHTFAAHGHAIFASSFAPSAGFIEWKLVDNIERRRVVDGAVTGEEVGALMRAFLEKPPERFFAWAHFVDPHDAYVAHEKFPPSDDPRRGLYDGEVAYEDEVIGSVLAALEASGAAATTAVILAADHGEAFGEHGLNRHGFSVYDEEVRVPLMVRAPSLSPRRIDVPRSTIDIARTVVALLGETPLSHWRGASLLDDALEAGPQPRPVLIDTPELQNLPAQRAMILGQQKVILHPTRGGVFDLQADPGERSPKIDAQMTAEAKAAFDGLEQVPFKPCTRR